MHICELLGILTMLAVKSAVREAAGSSCRRLKGRLLLAWIAGYISGAVLMGGPIAETVKLSHHLIAQRESSLIAQSRRCMEPAVCPYAPPCLQAEVGSACNCEEQELVRGRLQ